MLTHGDSINVLGAGLKIAAQSANNIIAAVYSEERKIYGVQFHPEVDLTVHGKQMLSNFCFDICRLAPTYTMTCRKEGCIKYIRENVGSNKVLLLVSGGVDSSVCAALLRVALEPDQVIALHIDNGEFS